MNWDAVGAVAEILGAIAVFATLLYLAIQIKQTNSIATSDATERLIQRYDDSNKLLVTDESLRIALYKTSGHTDDELNQINWFTTFKCNLCVSAQTAYSAGRLDKDIYLSVKKDLKIIMDMWPAFENAFHKWCKRYPDISGLEVFEGVWNANAD